MVQEGRREYGPKKGKGMGNGNGKGNGKGKAVAFFISAFFLKKSYACISFIKFNMKKQNLEKFWPSPDCVTVGEVP